MNKALDIVLVTSQSPEDPRNGGDLRLWWLLNEGHARVVCLARKGPGTHDRPLSDPFPWLKITAIDDRQNRPQRHTQFEQLVEAVEQNAPKNGTVLVSDIVLAHTFICRSSRPIVVDLCDSFALYHWRRFRDLQLKDPVKALSNALLAARLLRREVAIAKRARLTVVSSPVDAACLRRFAPRAPIRVVGNGTNWLSRMPPIDEDCHRERLVIHGAFGWYPNQAAAEYLATVVWPKIRAREPAAELHIVGPSLSMELRKVCEREGALVRGFVDDIFGAVASSGLYVAPMIAGSGVKNKIIEAMAAGVPVLTNPMGAEALPAEARRAVMVCDDPPHFADRIHDLLTNPRQWSKLRQKTRFAAEHCFDWSLFQRQFVSLLAEAAEETLRKDTSYA